MKTASFTRRHRRFVLFTAAALSAAALGYGIGIANAADPRLDEADVALQKAQALLEASQTDSGSDQARHRFAKAVDRAIGDIGDARAEIVDAKNAADSP